MALRQVGMKPRPSQQVPFPLACSPFSHYAILRYFGPSPDS